MKYFNSELLFTNTNESSRSIMNCWDEYLKDFNSKIQSHLPKNFIKLYIEYERFHDWYFEDMYIANSGKQLFKYSKSGMTLVITLYSNDKRIIITYNDVYEFDVKYKSLVKINKYSLNGFERLYIDEFELLENKMLSHDLIFENGNSMNIKFKYLNSRLATVP